MNVDVDVVLVIPHLRCPYAINIIELFVRKSIDVDFEESRDVVAEGEEHDDYDVDPSATWGYEKDNLITFTLDIKCLTISAQGSRPQWMTHSYIPFERHGESGIDASSLRRHGERIHDP